MRFVPIFALAGFLVWETLTRGFAAYLADSSPEKAIYLRPTEATALLNLAEKKLRDLSPKKVELVPPVNNSNSEHVLNEVVPQKDKAQSSANSAQDNLRPETDAGAQTRMRTEIHSLAERALVNDPLNARALRILGQLCVQASDDKCAENFMRAAARRSLFESEAIYWTMVKSYDARDYNATMKYADTLFKTRQQVDAYVMPILGRMAEGADAVGELKRSLEHNPPWRLDFFSRLSGVISDARTPLELLLSLKSAGAPPTTAELHDYLNFLVSRKFYNLAYYTWLQFLPPEQLIKVGNLFNGSFEFDPSGLPFDWVWSETPGATIKIVMPPDQEKERALNVSLGPGRVHFPGLRELIMLPPGNYRFQGQYKGNIVATRGLLWRIACADKQGEPIGESQLVGGQNETWQDFGFSFAVPKDDCSAQYVTLASGARSPSEEFISGTIWFGDLKLVNESVVAPSKEPS
jgi:hypothetical protein